MRLNRAFALSGSAFTERDRSHASTSTSGCAPGRSWASTATTTNTAGFSPHNWRLYARPTDGRLIALPWDLDRAFHLAYERAAHPDDRHQRHLSKHSDALHERRLEATVRQPCARPREHDLQLHLHDAVDRPPRRGHGRKRRVRGIAATSATRANYALTHAPGQRALCDHHEWRRELHHRRQHHHARRHRVGGRVHASRAAGQPAPLAVTWTSASTWSVSVPLTAGAMRSPCKRATSTARSPAPTASRSPAARRMSPRARRTSSSRRSTITPPSPTLGGNRSRASLTRTTSNSSSCTTAASPTSNSRARLHCGHQLHLHREHRPRRPAARSCSRKIPPRFQARYGAAPAGKFTASLAHGGETLTLTSAGGATIATLRLRRPRPVARERRRRRLLAAAHPSANDSRNHALAPTGRAAPPSAAAPASSRIITYAAWLTAHPALTLTGPLDDADRDGLSERHRIRHEDRARSRRPPTSPRRPPWNRSPSTAGRATISSSASAATSARATSPSPLSTPSDLATWAPANFTLLGSLNNGDGTETVSYRTTTPAAAPGFGSVRVTVDPP